MQSNNIIYLFVDYQPAQVQQAELSRILFLNLCMIMISVSLTYLL